MAARAWKAMRRERRWIVLADDGRSVTIGCNSDPDEDEIAGAGAGLRSNGLGGWLAVTEGAYYSNGPLSVIMVREIAPAQRTWEDAVGAFMERRRQFM